MNNNRISEIKNTLNNSSDIVVRNLNENISYLYLESVASDDKIMFLTKSIITIDQVLNEIKANIYNSHIEILDNINDSYYYLSSGYTIILINDSKQYIVVETKAKLDRGITDSVMEPLLRGPKDSFTENNSINLGLIRKRIKDHNLVINEEKAGIRTLTKVSIIYIKDIVKLDYVNKILCSLNEINTDGILDTSYIRDFLEKKQRSLFPKMISTERPDYVCQELLNGKIIIMVENSPIALILPATLTDFLKNPMDNYQKHVNTIFNKSLRWITFFITILTPAIYISLMTFNQELIPNQLLISLANQRNNIPFPTFIEVLIYTLFFEILREADMKSPSNGGASMSIVGALILGDASVAAGLVSPLVIIVIAITSVCELVFTDLDFINAIREWRILFILSTVFTGIIGIVSLLIVMIIDLSSLEILDTPYLTPISPIHLTDIIESIFYKPANKRERPEYLTNNRRKHE